MYILLLTLLVMSIECSKYEWDDYFDDYDKKPVYVNNVKYEYHWYTQTPNRTKSDYFYCGMDFGSYDHILGIRNVDSYRVDDIYDSDIHIDNFNYNILPNNTGNLYHNILPNNNVSKDFTYNFEIKMISGTYLKTDKRSYVMCYTNFNTSDIIGSICRETKTVRECFYTKYDVITDKILTKKQWSKCCKPDDVSNVLEERLKKCSDLESVNNIFEERLKTALKFLK